MRTTVLLMALALAATAATASPPEPIVGPSNGNAKIKEIQTTAVTGYMPGLTFCIANRDAAPPDIGMATVLRSEEGTLLPYDWNIGGISPGMVEDPDIGCACATDNLGYESYYGVPKKVAAEGGAISSEFDTGQKVIGIPIDGLNFTEASPLMNRVMQFRTASWLVRRC